MRLLYNALLFLGSPIWVPWMLWRSSRRNRRLNWEERRGRYDIAPHPEGKRIWVHAVSVGEVMAALPILRELRARLPDFKILLSVTTSSGHETALKRAEGLFDRLVYLPIDLPAFQSRAMKSVMPRAVVVMETELWMNFLHAAKSVNARTLLVNGRISDRSFPRAMKIRSIYAAILANVDRCLMQTQRDVDRIRRLGARAAEVFGNSKFDEAVEGLDTDPEYWRNELGLPKDKPVLVIGSTRGAQEEEFVLNALRIVGKDIVSIVWAPRHLERAEQLAMEMKHAFGSVSRRSKLEKGPPMLLDSYGELSKVYAVADFVVIGGGFENFGGQNIIQPLAHGKPILHGEHMQNFADVSGEAQLAGASLACGSFEDLAESINRLLRDEELRNRMGRAAKLLAEARLGSSARYAEAIVAECHR